MKVINSKAERDQNGKNKILVELDEDDIIVINDAIRKTLEDGAFDKDDHKYLGKLNHLKEVGHDAWTKLRPS